MEIKVLGPLEAMESGSTIAPTAAKPRQILSLLALHAGQPVPVPVLIEELWGTAPPKSALTTLQTYILHLRRNIGAALGRERAGAAKEILITRHNGYLINLDPEAVDAKRYERFATAGRCAANAGDDRVASDLLRNALELWRGEALVDVHVGSRLGLEVAWLEESRLAVLEARIEADLRLGQHTMLLSELAVLTARNPMNENLYCLFMLALYRAGRQWQALEAFKTLRRSLVDEFGVEPSGRAQQLQRSILSSDTRLDYEGAGLTPALTAL
jgi:DNA-binding SARP family transcriptional activator